MFKQIMVSVILGGVIAQGAPAMAQAQTGATTTIMVDASANRRPISPLIYGVCFGSKDQLDALGATINRQGGNNFTRYNWKVNTDNIDNDWYFESIPGWFLGTPQVSLVPGHQSDMFIADSKAAGAQPMISIPMLGWVAKVDASHETLGSFAVAKYGPQQKTDPERPQFGNGVKPDGTYITGNDPNDADVPSDVAFQREWVRHLIAKWGRSDKGGVRYYIMDNEPGLWHSTHRDVHPNGCTSDEYLADFLNYASMVKSEDPSAIVAGPEAWGWPSFFWSGADQQYRALHHYQGNPDKDAHGGMDYMPWLLSQIHAHDQKTGKRLLDVFTFHIYPQGGDSGDDVSPKIELLRNRDTRAFWDPNYVDEDWINDKIMLIPRMKHLVDTYYPGTKIGITEYNWGAENSMNGATAQADIEGIFGREGVYLATRWEAPKAGTPVFCAMQMYRNYDGNHSAFGDESISDSVPDPDTVSSFAAVRSKDHALTIMVINKQLTDAAPVLISLTHFNSSATAQVWQLAGDGKSIAHLPDIALAGNDLQATLPAQSITLFIVPSAAG